LSFIAFSLLQGNSEIILNAECGITLNLESTNSPLPISTCARARAHVRVHARVNDVAMAIPKSLWQWLNALKCQSIYKVSQTVPCNAKRYPLRTTLTLLFDFIDRSASDYSNSSLMISLSFVSGTYTLAETERKCMPLHAKSIYSEFRIFNLSSDTRERRRTNEEKFFTILHSR